MTTNINYRQIVNIAGKLAAAAGLTALYSWQIEPRWVEYTQHQLPVRHLPEQLHGRTLIQISDMHIGRSMSNSHYIRLLQQAAQLNADFIVYTGDFVAFKQEEKLYKLREVLAHAPKGKLGTAAILGNHDYGRGWSNTRLADQIVAALSEVSIPTLRNTICNFSGLNIAGLEEIWSPNHNPLPLMRQLNPQEPTILLCHNPEALDLPIWSNYHGWVLSGHTHGGQIKIPYMKPIFLPMDNKEFVSGEFTLPSGQNLYVNRGLGHSFPFRFGSRPEITIHTLINAEGKMQNVE